MKTKNAIIIFVLSLCVNFITGQGIVKHQSFSTNLNVYIGTWEYTSGNETFRISLKNVSEDTDISYGSCLIGDCFYSKNNVILDSYSISEIPTIYNDISMSLS